jgi:hypothetical protein
MAKTLTTQQTALARMTGEIDDEHRSHLLRAANWKLERRLHEIQPPLLRLRRKPDQNTLPRSRRSIPTRHDCFEAGAHFRASSRRPEVKPMAASRAVHNKGTEKQ